MANQTCTSFKTKLGLDIERKCLFRSQAHVVWGIYSNITPSIPAEGRGEGSERLSCAGVSHAARAEIALLPPVSAAAWGRQPRLLRDAFMQVVAWPDSPAPARAGPAAVRADRQLASVRQGCAGRRRRCGWKALLCNPPKW